MWTVIWDLKLLLAIHQLMVLFPQSHSHVGRATVQADAGLSLTEPNGRGSQKE